MPNDGYEYQRAKEYQDLCVTAIADLGLKMANDFFLLRIVSLVWIMVREEAPKRLLEWNESNFGADQSTMTVLRCALWGIGAYSL